jgi:hypothetical protein
LVAKAEVESGEKIGRGGRMIEMRVGGRVEGNLTWENLQPETECAWPNKRDGKMPNKHTRRGLQKDTAFANLSSDKNALREPRTLSNTSDRQLLGKS